MEVSSIDAQTEDAEESNSSLHKGIGLAEVELPCNSRQQVIDRRCIQGVHATDLTVPKYMRFASLYENYLQYCWDLVEFRAAKSLSLVCSPAVSCSISVNLISSKNTIDNKSESRRLVRKNTSDLGAFAIQCPSSARSGQCIVSTIDRHRSGRNTRNNPLLHTFGAVDSIMNIASVGSIDVKQTDTGSMSFSSRLGIRSPKKLETETACIGNQKHGSKSSNKRCFSISDSKSTGSGKSCASSTTTCQGILHCKWENGIPNFLFFVDGQREVYVAKASKVESSDYKDPKLIYSFYTRKSGGKAHDIYDSSLVDLVGSMKVSTSLTLCSDSGNTKTRQTEFVLFADGKLKHAASSDSIHRKHMYPNKVVDIFRLKHMLRHRSSLKFGSQSSIPDFSSLDSCEDTKLVEVGSERFRGSPHCFELAAIIVKEQVPDNNHQAVVGGWGVKFLEKFRSERANTSQEASVSSDNSQAPNKIRCSTNMNVIIPAGFHGGPSNKNGGPSCLIARWQSGGHCDCGGWDIGCPLTVLSNCSIKEVSTNAGAEGEKRSIKLASEGTRQSVPSLKMVNIQADKYKIEFHSSLSALQSFSVGVAVIHTQSLSHFEQCTEKLEQ